MAKSLLIFWFLFTFTASSSFNNGNSQISVMRLNKIKSNNIIDNKEKKLIFVQDSLLREQERIKANIKKTLDTIKQQQKKLKHDSTKIY